MRSSTAGADAQPPPVWSITFPFQSGTEDGASLRLQVKLSWVCIHQWSQLENAEPWEQSALMLHMIISTSIGNWHKSRHWKCRITFLKEKRHIQIKTTHELRLNTSHKESAFNQTASSQWQCVDIKTQQQQQQQALKSTNLQSLKAAVKYTNHQLEKSSHWVWPKCCQNP